MDENMAQFNKDKTGSLSEKEFELYQQNEKLQATLAKQDAQRKMAWTAVFVIISVTAILFHPSVSDKRIETIIPMLDWFYIAMASIPGAFMGMTAWMSKK
jgi:hypothetical protein